jgi:hypothetical protein
MRPLCLGSTRRRKGQEEEEVVRKEKDALLKLSDLPQGREFRFAEFALSCVTWTHYDIAAFAVERFDFQGITEAFR